MIDDDEPDYQKDDPLGTSRKHCWVYVQKAKRELSESFFIEPSTGRKYSIEDAPYHHIESIFNHKNYWINMDWKRPIDEVNLEFEYEQNGEWEYVMLKNDQKRDDDDEAAEDEEASDDEGGTNAEEEVLDMPPAWSPKLNVNRDKFIELCPKGEKTVFYKKCKVEFFSDCK